MEFSKTMEKSDVSEKTKRKWTRVEKYFLIQCVLERERDLFGDIKGSGGKRKPVIKKEASGDICDHLNS